MTDGVFVRYTRCKTKKALKEAASTAPGTINIECTSAFGGYDGPATEAPEGETFYIVGPDPYTKRNWYAQLTRRGDRVVVK